MRTLTAALFAALALLATGCAAEPPTYEADPIGGDERCFNIERESSDFGGDEETNLGTFCRSGAESEGEDD